jgi:hypothetical protein
MTNVEIYGINALSGFLKATLLLPARALEFLSEVFSVLFSLPDIHCVPPRIFQTLLALPPDHTALLIPQITAQIAHPLLAPFLAQVARRIAGDFFEQLYYALSVYADGGPAAELLAALRADAPAVAADADLFRDGMLRSAVTWFDSWMHALERIARGGLTRDFAGVVATLRRQAAATSAPRCELDRIFVHACGALVQEALTLAEAGPSERLTAVLHELFVSARGRSNKLSVVLLPKVSEALAAKRGFQIAVPGRYKQGRRLEMIEPAMEVIGTQQHPRIVFMNSVAGKRYKYLLKGMEDLRNDERLMQFFSLANSILSDHIDQGVAIVRYAVVPLAQNAGIIAWVDGADTFHQMVCDGRKSDDTAEHRVIAEFVASDFALLGKLQKLELFGFVVERCHAEEIFRLIWARAPSALVWVKRTARFTATTALMSMIGYVIGLGDRHPSNIMVQRETGTVVHIDFGESFESTLSRAEFPERVQFRLTRMIEKALEASSVRGYFTRMCETVLDAMRSSRWALEALLAIFVKDSGSSGAIARAIARVSEKLRGQIGGQTLPIERQVAFLIDEARDPMNYVQHYPGWCPFW